MDKLQILKVLDMNEKKQRHWLIRKHFWLGGTNKESLADLVFRLRDEVKDLPNFVWSKAWHLVVAKVMYNYNWTDEEWERNFEEWTGSSDAVPGTPDREIFALYDSKPIHWIIAALIAKEI